MTGLADIAPQKNQLQRHRFADQLVTPAQGFQANATDLPAGDTPTPRSRNILNYYNNLQELHSGPE
jgi:hypothetical protein